MNVNSAMIAEIIIGVAEKFHALATIAKLNPDEIISLGSGEFFHCGYYLVTDKPTEKTKKYWNYIGELGQWKVYREIPDKED